MDEWIDARIVHVEHALKLSAGSDCARRGYINIR